MKTINWNEIDADAILIINPTNIRYFTKFDVSFGYLIITKSKNKMTLFLDKRYYVNEKHSFKIEKYEIKKIYKYLTKFTSIAFESDFVSVDQKDIWTKNLKKANWVKCNSQKIRDKKDEIEIKSIDNAAKIAFKALNFVIKNIKSGMTEIEIKDMIEQKMLEYGSEEKAFSTIVASGTNGALPHFKPSDKKVKNGELITIDFGATINGYKSDITRTLKLGTIKNSKLQKIYDVVKEAQIEGIKSVKPNMKLSEVDKVCRNVIKKHGFEKYFVHSTGHGLGLDIHELPMVNATNNLKLEPGNVITIEPGIYIEKLGGVRIEDDILVTNDGYKILGTSDINYLK